MADMGRLVEVVARRTGSGYLIADRLVLTSFHLFRPALGQALDVAATIRIEAEVGDHPDPALANRPARLIWPLDDLGIDLDFALLVLGQRHDIADNDALTWMPLGNSGRLEVNALGYPDTAKLNARGIRDTREISGWVMLGDQHRRLKQGGMFDIRMSDEDTPVGKSPIAWPGMSGAAVLAGASLVGIVRIAGDEGDRHVLRALPVARMFEREDVLEAVRREGVALPPRKTTGSRVPRQLPRDIDGFVGRADVIDQVEGIVLPGTVGREALPVAAGGPKVICISGMGGVGKSALAIHIAHRIADVAPDGQLYADFQSTGSGPSVGEILANFVNALGCDQPMPDSVEGRASLFRSVTVDRRLLMVIDNAQGAKDVRSLLPSGPDVVVLVTSRRKLTELPGATLLDLEVLDDEEALVLLRGLLGDGRRLELDADARDYAAIAQACGRLPLALRIAGGTLASKRNWSAADYARRLASENKRLSALKLGDLELRGSFALSVAELPRDAAQRFALLGCVASSRIAIVTAALVWGQSLEDARDGLDALCDVQLLQAYGRADTDERWIGARAYELHDLLRLFAAEQLALTATREAIDQATAQATLGADVVGRWNVANLGPLFKIERWPTHTTGALSAIRRILRTTGLLEQEFNDFLVRSVAAVHALMASESLESSDRLLTAMHLGRLSRLHARIPSLSDQELEHLKAAEAAAQRDDLSEAEGPMSLLLQTLNPNDSTRTNLKLLTGLIKLAEDLATQVFEARQAALELIQEHRYADALETLLRVEAAFEESQDLASRLDLTTFTETGSVLMRDDPKPTYFFNALKAISYAGTGQFDACRSSIDKAESVLAGKEDAVPSTVLFSTRLNILMGFLYAIVAMEERREVHEAHALGLKASRLRNEWGVEHKVAAILDTYVNDLQKESEGG